VLVYGSGLERLEPGRRWRYLNIECALAGLPLPIKCHWTSPRGPLSSLFHSVDTTCIIECCHIWDQTLETEERVMVQTPSVYIEHWMCTCGSSPAYKMSLNEPSWSTFFIIPFHLLPSAVDTTCIIECCHIWDQTLETEERVMVQTPSVYTIM
jgi:hypothetical protein